MRKLLAAVLLGSLAGSASQRVLVEQAAPQAAATFKAGTKLVEVDVVVRDRRGPVAGLTRGDFTLLDNGKAQDIAVFAVRSAVARVGSSEAALPRGVVSNRANGNAKGEAPATQTILLLDRLFTGAPDQAYAIQRITKYLDLRRAQDGVGIYSIGGGLRVLQEVTDNDALLRSAVSKLKFGHASGASADTTDMSEHAAAEYSSYRERSSVMTLKHALQAIARHVAHVPGRKNLVWITQGFPLVDPAFGVDYKADMEEAARTLNDANVALYAVDARGLIGALGQMTGIPNAESRGAANVTRAMIAHANTPVGPANIETMNLLAGLTGGDVYFNTNGLEDSILKAVEDGDVTYSLGFYPAEDAQDGRVHRLKVKVAEGGVSLRYRENYFATKPQAEAENRPSVEQLMRDPLEATQIGVQGEAVADRARPGLFDVVVRVDLHDVQLGNQNGKWVGAVEVSFHVEDSKSAQVLTRAVEIPEAQLAGALEAGIVFRHAVEGPRKAGAVRVVVEDKSSGAAGSLRIPLAEK